jgi:CheY-like chemotaxis protein
MEGDLWSDSPLLSPHRVLIVKDAKASTLLREKLVASGLDESEIDTAPSGEEGVELVRRPLTRSIFSAEKGAKFQAVQWIGSFSVIVVDMLLAGDMDGLAVARSIRSFDAETPIIVATASGEQTCLASLARDAGASGLLFKAHLVGNAGPGRSMS